MQTAAVKIPWHRTPIDKDLLAELNRRRNLRPLVDNLGQLGFMAATAALALHAFHHWSWPLVVLTLFLPGYFIPTYLLVNQLGLVNTRLIVILLPSLSAWYILVMRANIRTVVTRELQEAALIDGANHLQIYVSLVLPLIKPILATIGLFAVVGSWNNFFLPLIYLNDRDKHPLTLILRRIVLEGEIGKYSGGGMAQLWDDQGVPGFVAVGFFKSFKFAAVVVTVWPVIVAYPFVQKYFVKGILVGSVKD